MLTVQEEEIIRLIIAEYLARLKMNKANRAMGAEIQEQFRQTDQQIRNKWDTIVSGYAAEQDAAEQALRDKAPIEEPRS